MDDTLSEILATLQRLNEGDRVRILNFARFVVESRTGKYARRRQALRARLNRIPSE
jgi:nucleoid DNA-binding protein